MNSLQRVKNIVSWTVFAIAFIVYIFSAERTGSLWDCGEFILGAYKLQVVHPPGAPLFVLVGRLFTWFAEVLSNDPSDIAFAVNLMSGMCTAFAAFFISRITMLFAGPLVSEDHGPLSVRNGLIGMAGLVAGLTTAFCSSIWFSAVEGEVYAMSTMFTAMTVWTASKWYFLPDEPKSDRWLLLCIYVGALSIGVHLLSLLTFPAIGLLYYFKKTKKASFLGAILGMVAGAGVIFFIQKFIIVGVPTLWKNLELVMVNNLGLPFHSGLILTLLLLAALVYFLLRFAHSRGNYLLQFVTMAGLMVMIGFSTIGVVVIRANADTPINMNVPSDAMRLLPYLNREQYGERPLLYGPHFDGSPKSINEEQRYGRVGDKYEIVDRKLSYEYDNKDKIFFPRIGHSDPGRPALHREWYKAINGKDMRGKPKMGYNLQFMFRYQLGWMYWRYFMWNFSGRQNGTQGYKPWNVKSGHWVSGIKAVDEARLHEMDSMTDTMKKHKAHNKYFMLPFLFGLIGLFYMALKRPKEFLALFVLFLITGIGIIIYSNQPPNEPRERDYVLVGSFMTYCIWIGTAVIALVDMVKYVNISNKWIPAGLAGALVMIAPILMGTQNYDDHSRKDHYASRDYATNFLNSVDENAIIFTYGDNDTYPLWYAQEVENVRRDVRVVNLSLIAVDWYINKLRSKVNDSEALKLTLDPEDYRGNKRNQVFFFNPKNPEDQEMMEPTNLFDEFRFIGHPDNEHKGQTISRSRNLFIPIDRNKALKAGLIAPSDSLAVDRINVRFNRNKNFLQKDELAVLDVLISNMYDRPIYFAVTCKNDKLLGLNDYMSLEGLALRFKAVRTPSDRTLSIFGSGAVNTDKVYNNVMNKWEWGNFDKIETFIDDSYAAELQAMKLIMMRSANELLQEGKVEKAAALSKKYFQAFPHFNFPYDNTIIPFIENLVIAGKMDEAKQEMRTLIEETRQNLVFYESLDEDDFKSSFQNDFGYELRAVEEILALSKQMKDPAFFEEAKAALGEYDLMKKLKD